MSRSVKFLPNSNGIDYARGYTEGARIYFNILEMILLFLQNRINRPKTRL
jgi:hypothetical protein